MITSKYISIMSPFIGKQKQLEVSVLIESFMYHFKIYAFHICITRKTCRGKSGIVCSSWYVNQHGVAYVQINYRFKWPDYVKPLTSHITCSSFYLNLSSFMTCPQIAIQLPLFINF